MENKRARGKLYLGTQGFSFDDWVGPFYPAGTPKGAYLEQYTQRLRTVEIDSTFYGVPRANVVKGWRARTPDGFKFSAKFPKLITHEKKLEGAAGDARAFVGTMEELGDKLGVLALQFAYDFGPENFGLLDEFLGELPEGHRYAVEVRSRRWLGEDLTAMLKRHGAALILQDLYYMPRLDWITAGFTYIRWLGRRADIEQFDRLQLDRSKEQAQWAGRVESFLDRGIDVWGYFNNHWAGHSPASVRQFTELLAASAAPGD